MNNQSSNFLWIRSQDYQRQLYISENYETIWGNPTESLYEHPDSWKEIILLEDHQPLDQEINKRLQPNEQLTESFLFYRVQGKDGAMKFIKDDCFALTDDANKSIGFLGLGMLLPEQQWQEELLRHNNPRLDPQQQLKKFVFEVLKKELRLDVKAPTIPDTHPSLIGVTLSNGQFIELTSREKECLCLLVMGKTAKQTALVMHISARTVEFHLNNIKDKFACRTKLELMSKAANMLRKN